MAYNFTAEKSDPQNIQSLHERLTQFDLVEFFPIEVSESQLMLGISIPFKFMDDPRFGKQLTELMTYLVSSGFHVVDLFTGEPIRDVDVSGFLRGFLRNECPCRTVHGP